MNKLLHGKTYYISVPDVFTGDVVVAITARKEYDIFARCGIKFHVEHTKDGWVVVPRWWMHNNEELVPLETFRGELYSAYEKLKRATQKIIKIQGGSMIEVQ